MSDHSDPDRSIARWLVAEATDRAPERLLEASRARVASTVQRRSLRLVGRFEAMNAYAKLGIAAAAVVVVGVVGISLGSGLNTVSSEASPTSSPPASPTASPSVAPSPATAPQPPVEFTGTIACGPPVRNATEETLDVGDDGTVLVRNRNGAWQQALTMSDPRLEGAIYNTYADDVYRAAGAGADGPTVTAYSWRITNDGGTWEARGNTATFADGSSIGDPSTFYPPSRVFVGSGGYEGLVAILETTAERDQGCVADVRGIIFDGAPLPEPYDTR
jgi:hypothetical protein